MNERVHAHSTAVAAPGSQGAVDDDLRPLLELAQQRDEAAARTLIERIHPVVAKVVLAHLPRREDPEDLYQEVYMKIFNKLGQYRGDAPFEHWVSRVARTTCFDKLRKQKVRPEWRWSDLSEDEQAVFERAPEADPQNDRSSAALELVDRILEQLPAQDAWLIRSTDIEETPFESICAEMGWRVATGRVRLYRARRKLKKALLKLEHSSEEANA